MACRSPLRCMIVLGAGLELWAGRRLGWRRALDLTDAPPDPALPRLVFGGPFASCAIRNRSACC